jgi:hypothetical protein
MLHSDGGMEPASMKFGSDLANHEQVSLLMGE